MKFGKALSIALLAGGVASVASAQQFTEVEWMGDRIGPRLKVDAATGQILGQVTGTTRAPGIVYNNYNFDNPPAAWVGSTGNFRNVMDDVSFTPGPWATAATRSITSWKMTVVRNTALGADPLYVQTQLRDPSTVSFTANPMFAAGAPVAATINLGVTIGGLTGNFIYGLEYLPFTPAVNIDPLSSLIVHQTIMDGTPPTPPALPVPSTNDRLRLTLSNTAANTVPSAPFPTNPAIVGFTNVTVAWDANNDGIFAGGATPGAPNDNRNFAFSAGTIPTGLGNAIEGDIVASAPPSTLLTLPASNTFGSVTGTNGANGVTWYRVELPFAAADQLRSYFDIDTEGSASNVSIAVYTAGGALVTTDRFSGSGENAQLSFGTGRRAAVGDGRQYDGRNWDDSVAPAVLGLDAATYYIAVAAEDAGAATFGAGYTATGNGAGGAFTLRIRTNVAATPVLDPSVAPAPNTRLTTFGTGVDPIVAPGAIFPATPVNGPDVTWFSFTLCRDADASNAISFSTAGTEMPNYQVYLFNSSGNSVGTGTGVGTVPGPEVPVNLAFGGASPTLPAGEYYLALAYSAPVDVLSTVATDGRWHVRGRNASSGFDFALTATIPWADCPAGGPTCDSLDYNLDGDFPTPLDLEDFINAVAGNICPTCNSDLDFNNDGDFPTPLDIEAFISVNAGGPCL